MDEQNKLTDDQKNRIEKTLKRIRAGLEQGESLAGDEPAHVFRPDAFHDKK